MPIGAHCSFRRMPVAKRDNRDYQEDIRRIMPLLL